jgi:hypothetical protein
LAKSKGPAALSSSFKKSLMGTSKHLLFVVMLQIQGRSRNEIILDNIDHHLSMINDAQSATDINEFNRTLTYFSNSTKKSSTAEQKDQQIAF